MGYTPPQLNVTTPTGYTHVRGLTTNGDLIIFPNPVASQASITLQGGGSIVLDFETSSKIIIQENGTTLCEILYATPDVLLQPIINKNLFLNTTGTGKLKVGGTATGTGDVAINGYYEILDSLGATIKLARVA
jgi:hypothetical protein